MKYKMNKFMAMLLTLVMVVCMWNIPGIFSMRVEAKTYSGTCGYYATWEFDSDTGVLNIAGKGDITSSPWSDYSEEIKKVEIAEGITKIAGFHNLNVTEIVIPSTVKVIGTFAIEWCPNLKKIEIPEGVETIEGMAFHGCSGLESVYIPKSVSNIDENPFTYCNSIDEIVVSEENPYYDSRGNCNAIIKTDTNELIGGCANTIIPEDVESIERTAFMYITKPMSVHIPASVKDIHKSAFSSCTSVTDITVDEKNIWYDSRDNCNAIIETASNKLILGCGKTVIPNEIVTIGNSAFEECGTLTKIVIPDSVETIEDWAFYKCDALKELSVPCSAVIEDFCSFNGSENIEKVTITKGTGTTYDNGWIAPWRLSSSTITELTIEEGVTSIPSFYFYSLNGLTKLVIPDSVTSIGSGAFNNCSNITELTIPCSAKIENKETTFGECGNIEKITITKGTGVMPDYSDSEEAEDTYYKYTPWYKSRQNIKEIIIEDSVENIGAYAFYGNTEVTTLSVAESVNIVGENAFSTTVNIKACGGTAAYDVAAMQGNPLECLKHSYTNYNVEKDATCNEDGLMHVECDYCDASEDVTIFASHLYVHKVVEPTSTEKGYTLHKCIICQQSYKDTFTDVVEEPTDSETESPTIKELETTTVLETTTEPETTTMLNIETTGVEQTTTAEQTTTKISVGRVKIKSAKNVKKKSITLRIKKVNNAKKYKIQYSTDKKFKKNVKSKTVKKLKFTIGKLKKGKTYYIRVRAVNGNIIGDWSKVKKVEIKK